MNFNNDITMEDFISVKEAYEQGRADAIDEFREKVFDKLSRLTLSMHSLEVFDFVIKETYKELKEQKQ